MPNRVVKDLLTYGKNVGKHVKRLAQSKETLRDAIDSLSKDSDKLLRAVKHAHDESRHVEAARFVERGRRKYNEKNYQEAENCFRDALLEDPEYALAYAYLGFSLYRMDRIHESIHALTRAVELDPGSAAAQKAEKRLKSIQQKTNNVIADLEHRIKPQDRSNARSRRQF